MQLTPIKDYSDAMFVSFHDDNGIFISNGYRKQTDHGIETLFTKEWKIWAANNRKKYVFWDDVQFFSLNSMTDLTK